VVQATFRIFCSCVRGHSCIFFAILRSHEPTAAVISVHIDSGPLSHGGLITTPRTVASTTFPVATLTLALLRSYSTLRFPEIEEEISMATFKRCSVKRPVTNKTLRRVTFQCDSAGFLLAGHRQGSCNVESQSLMDADSLFAPFPCKEKDDICSY